jgi:3-oxoacyl-[acyl-carrier-protein] synthase II
MPSGNRRVVITGVGLITALGNDVPSNWDALLSGVSGCATITRFDPSDQPVQFAAEVKNFDPTDYLDRKEVKRADRFTHFALVGAAEAMENAGFGASGPDVPSERFGVITGSGIGGITTLENQHQVYLTKGPERVSPFFVPMFIADMAPGLISMKYGAKGPNYSTQSACASSAHAIGNAFKLIQRGVADVFVSGGTESSITQLTMAGFASMKALSFRNGSPETASRPFDATRDGFVLGEGCGMVVLEEMESAGARGAPIIAELVGYGLSSDAHHMTAPAPEGEGAQRAMVLALEDAGEMVVSSTKSMTGHTLGAAGGVEGVVTALALKEGKIPPTINYREPDPGCDLNYAPNEVVERPIRLALTNSFGFGGHNVCLAIKRWEE